MSLTITFGLRRAIVLGAIAAAGCIIHDPAAGAGGAVGGNMIPASELRPLRQAGAAANRRIGTAIIGEHPGAAVRPH